MTGPDKGPEKGLESRSGPGAQGEPVLRLSGITRRFGALLANDAIDLTLHRGEVVALLGENGAGKTTLMNILFGHYLADAGTVEAFGRPLPPGTPRAAIAAGIGMVHQHFTLADNLSVLDNILLGTRPLWAPGLNKAAARAKVLDLAERFGLAVVPEARVASLSVGERQRVEILKALYRDARVLILDEPTAVLTPQESQALFATLRRMTGQGLAIIVISHKLHEVLAVAHRIVVLRQGRVAGTVAAADTDRAALARLMVGAEVPDLAILPPIPGPVRVHLRGVTTAAQGRAPGLRAVDLNLRGGQVTGIAGVSGNGQAALAGLLAGLVRPVSGIFKIDGRAPGAWSARAALAAGVARIPEDRHRDGAIADFTLTENAVLEGFHRPPFGRFGWMNWRAARAHAARLIADWDVRCPGPEARIRLLSGGNMQKLILGRALAPDPGVILADQPARGLDVGAIAFVQSRLLAARDRGAAVLLISEDLDEVLALSDVVHVISDGRLSPPFARGTVGPVDLGVWMSGAGFDHAA